MRWTSAVLLAVVTACSASQELIQTTPPQGVTTTTATAGSSTVPEPPDSTTTPTTAPEGRLLGIEYREMARLPFPIQLTALPGAEIAYIAIKDGRILAFDGLVVRDDPVLDIREQVKDTGEQGFLSIALHPIDTHRLFAHYSASDGDTVVSEFSFTSTTAIDPGSERVLLRLDQPAGNHNGGMIQFGADGLLYLGLGDGGAAGDRFGNSQNTETLLGGLVALRVDGDPDPELFSHGLRNPWRFWIDEPTGTIYIADVGQGAFEEVSVTPFEAGLNYGWPITEGRHCFRPRSGCDSTGLTLPVVEVSHGDAGTCSITGGIVYRGPAIPELSGVYFYSDYCGGYLRSFTYDGGVRDQTDWTDQVGVPGRVVSFGVDGAGEMYVLTNERLLKVVPVRG